MLQAALGALILIGIYRFMKSDSNNVITWWVSFVFLLVPTFLIFILSLALIYLNLNPLYSLFGYLLFFIFPFCLLRFGLDFKNKAAIKYSVIVPFVAIFSETVVVYGLSAI